MFRRNIRPNIGLNNKGAHTTAGYLGVCGLGSSADIPPTTPQNATVHGATAEVQAEVQADVRGPNPCSTAKPNEKEKS